MEDRGAVLATLCGLRGILMSLNPKPLDPGGTWILRAVRYL